MLDIKATRKINKPIEELLQEPGFKESARRFRPRLERYAEDRVAERAVETLLERGIS